MPSGCTGLLCRIQSVTVVYLRCAQWLYRSVVSDSVSESGLLTMCPVVVQVCCVGFSQWQRSTSDLYSCCSDSVLKKNRIIWTIRNTSSNWLQCCVFSVSGCIWQSYFTSVSVKKKKKKKWYLIKKTTTVRIHRVLFVWSTIMSLSTTRFNSWRTFCEHAHKPHNEWFWSRL